MKRILLIDLNDSFTGNIKDILKQFNCKYKIVKYSDFMNDSALNFDGIIISPGPGHASEYRKIYDLLSEYCKQIPILGICLGHQIISSFYGADLFNLKEVVHGQKKKIIKIFDKGILKSFPLNFEAGLYHSWSVKKNTLPDCLRIEAIGSENTIMAVSHKIYPSYGLQFHPESFLTPLGKKIFLNFLNII